MKNKYHNILEFNIIIDEIKKYARLINTINILDNYELKSDIDEIKEELAEVDEASRLIYRSGIFPLYFDSEICDLLDKANKFGVLNIADLIEVQKFLDSIRNIINYSETLSENNIDHIYFDKNLVNFTYPKELNVRLREIMTPYGEILDSASSKLFDIRRNIINTKKNIQSKLNELVSKYSSILSEAIVTTRNDRFVIPVKNDFKNSIKGITHDSSNTGSTVYIEPTAIFELNNKLNNLYEEEKEEIYQILREYSLSLKAHYDELMTDYNIICHLDLIYSKASYSNYIEGNMININDSGFIELYNCHHPLLNTLNIVNNDIILGKDYKGIIITGPNTGGKTVILKTMGIISLMVRFGLLVPASPESSIMIFDEVYADIGDDQNISQNLSTFSSHMKNIIEIMDKVTKDSLVLLDEVGSGTDPVEGSGLAIAIFDTLIERNCLVCATSHYSNLVVHALKKENIINASVEFDAKTLKPTYRLLLGIPGKSNALYISKNLGLSEEVINKARTYTNENSDEVNVALRKLIHQSEDYNRLVKKTKEKNRELNELIEKQKEELNNIALRKNEILNEASTEAKKILEKNQKKIDALISELEEMKLKETKLHEISSKKHDLKEIKEALNIEEEIYQDDTNIEVGSIVYVNNYGVNGEVIKKLKGDKFLVQAGNAQLTIDLNNLKKVSTKPKEVVRFKSTPTDFTPRKHVSMSLDLRGERYEEAKDLLDKYLDDALYAGLASVAIIHGFGTGAIRTLVQNTLKTNKNVESFRYGGQGEGGQGATIVYFKNK